MEFRYNGRHGRGYQRVAREQRRREAEFRNGVSFHVRTKAHRLNKCGCDV